MLFDSLRSPFGLSCGQSISAALRFLLAAPIIQQLIKQLKKKNASADHGQGAALPGGSLGGRSSFAGWVAV
jgi:hypothetical protein